MMKKNINILQEGIKPLDPKIKKNILGEAHYNLSLSRTYQIMEKCGNSWIYWFDYDNKDSLASRRDGFVNISNNLSADEVALIMIHFMKEYKDYDAIKRYIINSQIVIVPSPDSEEAIYYVTSSGAREI